MISFIIPAHNEERLIGRTLTALGNAALAAGHSYEIVVVDDASSDHTASLAREHGAQVIAVAHRQIAATRNAGARQASGEIFVFLDADTVVNEAVIRSALGAIKQGAVGGGCAVHFDGRLPLYGRAFVAVMVPFYRVVGLASGCFLFCTRAAFYAVGGFDERLFAAEEGAMSRALGRQGRFVVLREFVVTSGRKFRAYTAREIFGLLARLTVGRRLSVRRREGLDLWYGERRTDPSLSPDDLHRLHLGGLL
jgi:glycosyltransferase involved in cell wall biosynthesis